MTSSTTSKSAPQLDARQERDLKQAVQTLWVRFPGSLEDRYRDYAERRAAKLIQRSLYILIVLFLIVSVPVSLLSDEHNRDLWMAYGVYPIAISLALLSMPQIAVMKRMPGNLPSPSCAASMPVNSSSFRVVYVMSVVAIAIGSRLPPNM